MPAHTVLHDYPIGASTRRTGRLLLALALALAVAGSAGVQPAPAASKHDRAISKAVERLRTAIRQAPRKTLKGAEKRRNVRLAKRAAADFRRKRYCKGLLKVELVKRTGRLKRAVTRVERAIARSKKARKCQIKSRRKKATAQTTTGGGFPAAPKPPPLANENDQGGEEKLPPLPAGKFRPGLKPGAPSGSDGIARSTKPPGLRSPFSPRGVNDPVNVFVKTDLGNSNWTGSVQDPSEASAGNVVLLSVNRNLGYSTDGGSTFTYVDPTTIFATNPDGGICCDMVLHYDPGVNRFFWLIQYNCSPGCTGSSTSENRYRLALASPAQVASSGATAWKYFDFTSDTFDANNQWMDYPDVTLGTKSLYFTFDLPRNSSAAWVRIAMSDLVNKNSIGFRYYKKAGDYVLKTFQNTKTRGWIARRKSDPEFELTHWDDGSIYVYHHSVTFPTPPTENCVAKDPDSVDMLAMFDCAGFSQRVGGAAQRSNGDLWIGWTAGRRVKGQMSDAFKWPHIQLLTVDDDTMTVKRNRSIYNDNHSWSYPSLSASSSGEVTMTYFTGAGTAKYPNMGVGFLTNKESFVRVATGAKGRARIGDYQAVRPARPSSKRFSAAGYVLDSSNNFHPWWALFGRSSDKPVTIITLPPIFIVPPPPPPPPPDLIVSALASSSITVKNQGPGPAGPFTAVIVDSNAVTLTFTFTGLAAGASATRTFDCDALSRQRTAIVDSNKTVAETNEANNTASGIFDCPIP